MSEVDWKTQRTIKLKTILCILLFNCGINSCKKFLQVTTPSTEISSKNVYTSNSTAISVLTGEIAGFSGQIAQNMTLDPALSADELTLFYQGDPNLIAFYRNALTSTNVTFWQYLYGSLEATNTAIQGLTNSTTLSPDVKSHLLGESKFLRAFCDFYLVNYYGDIPLVTTSDYRINSALGRTSVNSVYDQIIADLKDAQMLLADVYLGSDLITATVERIRPNKWTATALLARVYLFTQKWDSAELEASEVINQRGLYSLDSLPDVFLKNSSESIWQLQPTQALWNTADAMTFILPGSGPSVSNATHPVYLSNYLLNAFDSNDARMSIWINSVMVGNTRYFYPYKYKSATSGAPLSEYQMVMRLGEQYLIRSEARARKNNIHGSQNDLDTIRLRAHLPETSAQDQQSLYAAILHERQVELFTEWGNRWLDLKRTQSINEVMPSVCQQKSGNWSLSMALYPLPLYDLQQDKNLAQNPGYN